MGWSTSRGIEAGHAAGLEVGDGDAADHGAVFEQQVARGDVLITMLDQQPALWVLRDAHQRP
jgi:hypothetical protein